MQKWTPLLQYFPLLTFLTFLSANCSIKNSPALDSAQAAGLQLVSNKKALRHICTELASFNGTGVNAGEIIQVCINNTPPGGILELPAGIYTLTQQITFNRAFTLQTEGKEGAPICDHELGLDCATFVAAPNFNIRFGLMLVSHPDVTLDHIVLDGNRQARLATPTGSSIAKNCLSDNTFGFNARAEAPGFSFLSSVSKGALCGTALGVANGENLKILYSAFFENGDHRTSAWADGLTIADGSNADIVGNYFAANTDIDLIFGGCQNCRIQNNIIRHEIHFRFGAFAALMTHAWPDGATSGEYAGSDISANVVDCGVARQCGFGMLLGSDPWYPARHFGGGTYHDNWIANAQEGFNINHSTVPLRIFKNQVQNSGGGTIANCGQRETGSYNISPNSLVDFTGDNIPFSSYRRVDWKNCIPNFHEFLNPALAEPVVRQMYLDILGRAADSSGLAHFTQQVRQSTVSKAWTAIAQSPEAANVVAGIYRSVLDRSASPGEISGWQNQMADGLTIRQLRRAFIMSPEGQSKLRQSLLNVLGREPLASERQSLGTLLLNGIQLPAGPATASKLFVTSYPVLRTFHLNCGLSEPLSTSCNAAIHRFCFIQGYGAGGFGPVEHVGDVAYVTCVPSIDANRVKTTFTELRNVQSLCDPANPLSVFCGSAINRFCANQGFNAGGFGPLEHFEDSVVIACASSPRAAYVNGTFTALQARHADCSPYTASSDVCKAAVHRSCQSDGFVSGYGLLEMRDDIAHFACLR